MRSVTESQDSFLRRAFSHGLRGRFRLGDTGADLFRRGRIIDPAWTESRQAQVDFAPFGMTLRLQGGKILAQGSRKSHQVTYGELKVVVVSDQERSHRDRREVLPQYVGIAAREDRRVGIDRQRKLARGM